MKKYDAPQVGVTCSCGKMRFADRRTARKTIRRMRGVGMGAGGHLSTYRCGDFWHIGNLPAVVVSGDITRDDIKSRPQPTIPAPFPNRSENPS